MSQSVQHNDERLKRVDQQAWIESIVQRVVQQLLQADPPGASVPAEVASGAAGGDLVLRDGVISVQLLHNRLEGVRRVVVGPKSVVTPAVKDELRQRKIEWIRMSSPAALETDQPGASQREATGLIPCWNQGSPGRLDPALMGLPLRLETTHESDWDRLRERIAGEIEATGQGILIALEPYRAVCELNRSAVLRVGYAPTSTALGKLFQQLEPNLVVVDARRVNHASLREVVQQLRAACG